MSEEMMDEVQCDFRERFVNSEDDWVNQVFSIELTLQEILKNLNEPDLLNISLVSKFFATKARDFLREHKKCVAIVGGERPCVALIEYATVLQTSSNIPFNGVSITTTEDSHNCHQCSNIADDYEALLTKMNLKYLKVDWKWSLDTKCPAQELLRMFLKEKSSDLKGLTICELPWGEFSGAAFSPASPETWLKNLTVLEFSTDVEIDLIEKILPCAPQLREIRGRVFPEHLKFLIPQRKLALIKDFRFYPELSNTDLVSQYASESPRLDSLELSAEELRRDNASMETFKICLQLLLTASSKSMKRLRIEEHLDILWFIYLRLPTLTNLQYLYVHYELDVDRSLGICSLMKIDWNRLFPNLNSMEISLGVTPYQMLARYVETDVLRNGNIYICTSVTMLTLPDQGRYFEEFYVWLSTVFPNVKHLRIIIYMEYSQHMSAICNYWPNAETIYINFKTRSLRYNIDSTLGGISPEEAEELRDKDSKFLESYQFVPVKPSFLTMTNLKQVRIAQLHHRDGYHGRNQDQMLISEMSEHLVFSKMPKVRFELSKKECKNGQCLTF